MKRLILRLCGAILVMFILIGCHDPIPVSTVLWEPDGEGFIQFATNDWHNWNTMFTNSYPSSLETPMTTVTIQLKKISGSQYGGYGIIFCAADSDNFYRFLIFTNGKYNIWKKVGGTYTLIKDFTSTSFLNTGLGALNKIEVTQSSPNNFNVSLNDNPVTTFNDATFTGGEAGFAAYVYSQAEERFPAIPVDVRFKMTSPVAVP